MDMNLIRSVNLPNGETYAYREAGFGEEVILLVHGNLVSSRHWGKLIEALGEKYKVYALDLRGAGHSSYSKPITGYIDWAKDIKYFCDELNLKDFTLLGWSMGGGISQRFIVDYPEYAKKLILLEAVPCSGYPYQKKGPNGEFLPECYGNKAELLEDKIQVKPMVDGLENNDRAYMKFLWDAVVLNVTKPEDDEYEILLDDLFMTRNLRDAAWASHSFNISHSFNGVSEGSGEVDKIELPVLILQGDKDLVVPAQMSELNAKEIGENAKLEVLENCSHTPHYDNLQLVVEKISEFINS